MAGPKGAPKRGWYRDPTGRHELRRWDGDGWSEWVMDGARRHFDDIDGCGGPPVGELVALDHGGGGGGAIARLRPRRPSGGGGARAGRGRSTPRFGGGGRGVRTGGGGRGSAGEGRLPPQGVAAGLDAGRRLTAGLVVTFAAAAVAFAVVTLIDGEAEVFEAVVTSPLRRLAVPFTLAAVAFHLLGAAGLLLARGSGGSGSPNPLRPPTRFAAEDLLRGGIAFLLGLFASSFVLSTVRPGGVQWSDIPARFDALFAVEALVLVVAAPSVQERLFRGLLLVVLRDRFGPVLGVLGQAAIAGAALAWTAAPGARGVTAFAAFATAGVFGWFAHSMDDLRPGMLGHAFLALWVVGGRLGF